MKLKLPVFVLAGAVAIAAVTGLAFFLAPSRGAEAASFARPNFDTTDRTLDLSRYGVLERRAELQRLAKNPIACRDALDMVAAKYTPIAAIRTGKGCGVEDAVLPDKGMFINRGPEPLEMTCSLAARLYLWETHVVGPAAEKHLGAKLDRIEALGAYSCRTVAETQKMSEHAFGKALDVSGFRLADGRTVSVLKDFHSKGPKGAFLREIHDRACDVFDVTLGPDFNAAHANHFHLDVGIDRACH